MGFSLASWAFSVFISVCVLLQASPSRQSLSQLLTEKTSGSTFCIRGSAQCESVHMAQSEDTIDDPMESQEDSVTMDTSCKADEDEERQEGKEGKRVEEGGEEESSKVGGGKESGEQKEGESDGVKEGVPMDQKVGEEDGTEVEDKEEVAEDSGGQREGECDKGTGDIDNKGGESAAGGEEKRESVDEGEAGDEGRGRVKRKEREADDEVNLKKPKPADVREMDMEEEEEEEPEPFPTTLDGFGYSFNDDGELRDKENRPFNFEVKPGNRPYNQAHYEALGEVVTEYVYDRLKNDAKLQRVIVPVDAKENDPTSFVFQSEDAPTKEKLMVLIHGTGVVRAGQWARRLIINDCLDSGTQLPYIRRAKEEGYGVLVLNTNRNRGVVDGKEKPIQGNSSPEEHATYVWEHIIRKCAAKQVYIVAHSYGGIVTTHLADVPEFRTEFQERVKKIAFTDSVHNFDLQDTSSPVKSWMISHSRNWVSSGDSLDTELMIPSGKVPRFSAGTYKHEETSHYSMDSIFRYFSEEQ